MCGIVSARLTCLCSSGFLLHILKKGAIRNMQSAVCSWMERGGPAFEQHVDAERGFAAAALAGDRDVAHALLAETLARLPEETV